MRGCQGRGVGASCGFPARPCARVCELRVGALVPGWHGAGRTVTASGLVCVAFAVDCGGGEDAVGSWWAWCALNVDNNPCRLPFLLGEHFPLIRGCPRVYSFPVGVVAGVSDVRFRTRHTAGPVIGARRFTVAAVGVAGGGSVSGHAVIPSKLKACCDNRLAISSQYASSISTPIARLPRLRAANRVEPEPANGSAMAPSGA